jgi:hypothetical protein
MKQSESFSDASCTDQMLLAGRELSAFIAAVSELFGADQARASVEDWVDELELMEISPRSMHRDWRTITIAASVRLANRLNVALHRQTSPGISTSIPSFNCSWEDSCSRLDSRAQSASR